MTTNELVTLIPAYIQALALIAAGSWTYWKFIYQRQQDPATDIELDVVFVGLQDDKWVVEVTAILENKSLVRHQYRNFRLGVRYFEDGDPIQDGDQKINYQLSCTKSINDRIGGEERRFANVNYINPRQVFRHRYITYVPHSASFVWVQGRFVFGKNNQTMNAQRIFKVPK